MADAATAPGFDPALLAVLVCPATRTPLLYVPAAEGEPACLLAPAGGRRYAIDGGVPVLLVDEAVTLTELEVTRLQARAAGPGAANPPEPAAP